MSDENPPFEVGQIIKLGLIGWGKGGDPMFKHKNYIIFLKEFKGKKLELNALLEIKIKKVFPNFGIAELTGDQSEENKDGDM